MTLVRNIVITVVAVAFCNRFFRQSTINDRNRLLQNYDYIIGKHLTQNVCISILGDLYWVTFFYFDNGFFLTIFEFLRLLYAR